MKVLVTGGTGFLGGAVCRLLAQRGDAVTSFARSQSPALAALGVVQVAGDVTSLDSLLAALPGHDAVIHVAAKPGAWGRLDDYYAANVTGTDNVIAACSMSGVHKLVHTSTPSVVHAGGDLEGVDESVPIATHFKAHYPATKALAEQHIDELDRKLRELQAMKATLEHLVHCCHGDDRPECPIIESLAAPSAPSSREAAAPARAARPGRRGSLRHH